MNALLTTYKSQICPTSTKAPWPTGNNKITLPQSYTESTDWTQPLRIMRTQAWPITIFRRGQDGLERFLPRQQNPSSSSTLRDHAKSSRKSIFRPYNYCANIIYENITVNYRRAPMQPCHFGCIKRLLPACVRHFQTRRWSVSLASLRTPRMTKRYYYQSRTLNYQQIYFQQTIPNSLTTSPPLLRWKL